MKITIIIEDNKEIKITIEEDRCSKLDTIYRPECGGDGSKLDTRYRTDMV